MSAYRTFLASLQQSVDNHNASRLGSAIVNQPPVNDEFASPLDYAPRAFDGPAPRGVGRKTDQHQEVWDAIARRHPRKFKAAIRYIKWLERMERRYESRTRL